MIIKSTGKICENFYVVRSPIAPVYLLAGPDPVLFDGGFTALTLQYETGIKEILKGRDPAYLFLTHSHFDHIGAAGHLQKTWPALRIGGSEKCCEILSKQSAVKLIRDLNAEGTKSFKKMGIQPLYEHRFEPFDIDIIVRSGTELAVSSDISVIPMNTPGHTWDFMSYWMPEKKIFIASEAVAIFESDGHIQPEFLVDVDAYLDSLEKIKALAPEILCAGHHVVFTKEDARDHIQKTIQATNDFLSMTKDLLAKNKDDIDRVVSKIKAMEWDIRPWPKQSESAYLLNTRQRVKAVRERMNKPC